LNSRKSARQDRGAQHGGGNGQFPAYQMLSPDFGMPVLGMGAV
jgi:hypothetical protein